MSASAGDLILLNATSPVNSCHFCHCGFQPLSWVCPGGGYGVEGFGGREIVAGEGKSEKRKAVEHRKA